ncbi:MAG: xanthine dehydrogenase family protein subunit M [Chloroflexi bacterium]|nr:MAG: xanthine dehydrogenase family protein subunit M [Chloroflexota bacterium]
MRPFEYAAAADERQALAAHGAGATYLAGGTCLVDLMKLGVETPARVVDISRLPLVRIELRQRHVHIGALARLSDVATSPLVTRECPAVARSLLASASRQLRNVATMGGNLLQRTRCPYFRDVAFACNRRQPGAGCAALAADSSRNAILGASDACAAVHPSDVAVALVALDARVVVRAGADVRTLSLEDLYPLPGETPARETALAPGELVVGLDVPRSRAAARSCYLKVRDRASFEFALVSVAAALEVDASGAVADARLALGGVGTRPWRVREAERRLVGSPPDREAFTAAAERAVEGAMTTTETAFKVELTRRAVVRALQMAVEATS